MNIFIMPPPEQELAIPTIISLQEEARANKLRNNTYVQESARYSALPWQGFVQIISCLVLVAVMKPR
jgi:hypothetical protein